MENLVIIFDIDGTLANIDHRVKYIIDKDYEKGYDLLHADRSYPAIVHLARLLGKFHKIVICTGRFECQRSITEEFIVKHDIPCHNLFMRPDGDKRSDIVVKKEMLDNIGKDNILMVFEDRDKVVDMWRTNGITCLQVKKGDY